MVRKKKEGGRKVGHEDRVRQGDTLKKQITKREGDRQKASELTRSNR